MRLTIALLLITLLTVTLASGQARPVPNAPGPLPTEETVNSFMRHTFSYDPTIEWKVLSIEPSEVPLVASVILEMKNAGGQPQRVRFFVMPDQKWAFVGGDAIPFGVDPFGAIREELAAKAKGPARGPAQSEMVVVEFSDLQCPVCKAAQPTVERLLKEFPNARFIFQSFPLTQHPWAFKAAVYAQCVAEQSNDAFWKFVSLTYENQEQVTTANADEKLKLFAQQAGGGGEKAAQCAAQPAAAAKVRESMALGEALAVSGTPTLFVNGRKVQNVGTIPYEMLKTLTATTKK